MGNEAGVLPIPPYSIFTFSMTKRHIVYVPVNVDRRFLTFQMWPDSGKLELIREVDTEHEPWQVCTDPTQRYLYQQVRDENYSGIASFRIDPATAELTWTGEVELEAAACYVQTDRTGRFVFAAGLIPGFVTVHPIGPDGVIQTATADRRVTERYAHSIQTDPSNRFVYVPHVSDSDSIYQFLFDENTGQLRPHSTPRRAARPGHGPRHFAFHPYLDVVYFNAEQASGIVVYRYNPDGSLEELQILSTLPDNFSGTNSTASVRVHPSGRMLYVPNRGHESIAMFGIDQATGFLSPKGHVAAEACPRPVGIDPNGTFFYAGSDDTGKLTTYRIDEDCLLQPLYTYDIGQIVSWILPLNFD